MEDGVGSVGLCYIVLNNLTKGVCFCCRLQRGVDSKVTSTSSKLPNILHFNKKSPHLPSKCPCLKSNTAWLKDLSHIVCSGV